ncbi:hypothetical protein M0M57_05475 [Flavobacterium azooxidireducens]|uniref:Uncharacterized protein n=1 Tax=Flavobacterium azooxidireducens TaxID=1871076 RepID=A0ABY4KHI5_9FLAO|nr:hypothetical protein [Flavobacterium azooxidireducens]UPQ80286.1 hypothetical protein M0M57_05475 [Flavobacterium azooxidireducens]
MKFLSFFLLFFNLVFSQHENELNKVDSVFVIFSESDKQKIYTKILEKDSNELNKIMYMFYFSDGKNCSFRFYKQFNYDPDGNEILKTYKLNKSFLRKNKHKIITYEEINEKGFINFIDFLRERKVYIIDLGEAKGRHLIARGVIFGFVAEE